MAVAARLLVIGANSAIATAVARRYAEKAAKLFLIARREDALAALAADLKVRGAAAVECATLDANDVAKHQAVLGAAWQAWQGIDAVLVAYGTLPDQTKAEASVEEALACFDTNAASVIALLTDIANRMEQQGFGTIGVISSPAGERGRATNYVYGAAKAAVTNFASGLRQRLYKTGIRVVTILPGFVDTPMTATFKKGALWAQPEDVAIGIERALERGFGKVYVPGFWWLIMLVIRCIPERVFVRMKI